MMDKAYTAVLNAGLVKRGETVVITAGIPVGEPGNTNLINVRVVK
jgi:pyruvate kinase